MSEIHTTMFLTALFTKSKGWEAPELNKQINYQPLTNKISKMWYYTHSGNYLILKSKFWYTLRFG